MSIKVLLIGVLSTLRLITPPDANTLYTFSDSLSIKEGVIIYPPEPTTYLTLEELAKAVMSSFLNSTDISDVTINEFSTGKAFLLGHPAVTSIHSGKIEPTQTEAKFVNEKTIIDNMGYSIGFSARLIYTN